jgi:1,4-dihydroxy-2-naphthoate octaprenyltransferase
VNVFIAVVRHLRFPFSWLLLPVFLSALVSVKNTDGIKTAIVFFVLHFLLYPASNSFNSFYDRDTGSIGLLKNPPPIYPALLWVSLILDIAAMVFALFVNWIFFAGVVIYGFASKAYSHPSVRVKKYPLIGWLFTGLGQGSCTALLVALSVGGPLISLLKQPMVWIAAILTSVFLLGFYPLSQVYQHAEDASRGDKTISLVLGVRGTFGLAAFFLGLAITGYAMFISYFWNYDNMILFLLMMAPAGIYFIRWSLLVYADPTRADYNHTMRLSLLASTALNVSNGWLLWMH